jgi:hypothetical protein
MKKNMKNRSKKINKSKLLRHNNYKHIGGGGCWSGPQIQSPKEINMVEEELQRHNDLLIRILEELRKFEQKFEQKLSSNNDSNNDSNSDLSIFEKELNKLLATNEHECNNDDFDPVNSFENESPVNRRKS